MNRTTEARHHLHPLRVWRAATGLSQKELAREAGIARSTVIRLEAGEVPTVKTANAVANVLGVDREALFPPEEQT